MSLVDTMAGRWERRRAEKESWTRTLDTIDALPVTPVPAAGVTSRAGVRERVRRIARRWTLHARVRRVLSDPLLPVVVAGWVAGFVAVFVLSYALGRVVGRRLMEAPA